MAPFSYEWINNGNYRVRDADDNRVATCWIESHAKLIVAALNQFAKPQAVAVEDAASIYTPTLGGEAGA